jgi:N-acetyl sugar amidotransferase
MVNSVRSYQICSRCILDTNDYPEIAFDDYGVCNICYTFDALKKKTVFAEDEGKNRLKNLIANIKLSGEKKEYDCLLTISGGVDSAYLSYMVKQWGLKPLVLHVDNGWNSELAVKNIQSLMNKLGFDLVTYVINWQELRDVQLAYLKASVIDLDVPSEIAVEAAFVSYAIKFGIKHILTGHNTLTEGWLPPNFTAPYKLDSLNLIAIHKRFGTTKLKRYKSIGFFKRFYFEKVVGLRYVAPLNLITYNKDQAKKFLSDNFGWRDYGSKHFENLFTRFYQGYILPVKYHVDKRKSHLSTLICSGQMSRTEALNQIKFPPYTDERQLFEDKVFFLKKLGLTEDEFERIMKLPVRQHTDYPSYISYYYKIRPLVRFIKQVLKLK